METNVVLFKSFADPKPQVNDDRMAVRFCVTSEIVDHEGDIVVVKGGRLDQHRKNPIVLLEHKMTSLVGKTETPEGDYTVETRPELKKMYANVYFHSHNQLGEQTYRLVKDGFMRGTSIGFKVNKASQRGAPLVKGGKPPLLISDWSLMEISITAMPTNPDAIREVIHRSFDGKSLHPHLCKALEPYAAELKAWSNGATLEDDDVEVKSYDENKHPRDQDGKWTSGSSGSLDGHFAPDNHVGQHSPVTGKYNQRRVTYENYSLWLHERESWGKRSYSFDGGHTWHPTKTAAFEQAKKDRRLLDGNHPIRSGGPVKKEETKSMHERIQSITVKADAFPTWLEAKSWLSTQGYEVGDEPTVSDELGSRFDFFPAEEVEPETSYPVSLQEKALATFGVRKGVAENVITEYEIRPYQGGSSSGVVFESSTATPVAVEANTEATVNVDLLKSIVAAELDARGYTTKAVQQEQTDGDPGDADSKPDDNEDAASRALADRFQKMMATMTDNQQKLSSINQKAGEIHNRITKGAK